MLFSKNKIKFGQKLFASPKLCTPVHLCNGVSVPSWTWASVSTY